MCHYQHCLTWIFHHMPRYVWSKSSCAWQRPDLWWQPRELWTWLHPDLCAVWVCCPDVPHRPKPQDRSLGCVWLWLWGGSSAGGAEKHQKQRIQWQVVKYSLIKMSITCTMNIGITYLQGHQGFLHRDFIWPDHMDAFGQRYSPVSFKRGCMPDSLANFWRACPWEIFQAHLRLLLWGGQWNQLYNMEIHDLTLLYWNITCALHIHNNLLYVL